VGHGTSTDRKVNLGDLGEDDRFILKSDRKQIGCVDVDWIHLTKDRDQGLVEGSCEEDNKTWRSIESGQNLD